MDVSAYDGGTYFGYMMISTITSTMKVPPQNAGATATCFSEGL